MTWQGTGGRPEKCSVEGLGINKCVGRWECTCSAPCSASAEVQPPGEGDESPSMDPALEIWSTPQEASTSEVMRDLSQQGCDKSEKKESSRS